MKTFLALLSVLGFANAHPSGYKYSKPTRPFAYPSERTISKATSSLDCDPVKHTMSAGEFVTSYHAEKHDEREFVAREGHDFHVNVDQKQEKEHGEQFDSSEDDTVVIDTVYDSSTDTNLESEEVHNVGIAVAVADEHESEERDSALLEPTTSRPLKSDIDLSEVSTKDVESSTQNQVYDTKISEVDAIDERDKKVTVINGKVTEPTFSESGVDEISTKESKYDCEDITGSQTIETETKINGGYGSDEVSETKFTGSSKSDHNRPETSVVPISPRRKTVKTQNNGGHEDSKYDRQPSSFFPIYFGSFPSERSSTDQGGVVSIANSFSTGQAAVASSHSTAYGSSRPAEKSTR